MKDYRRLKVILFILAAAAGHFISTILEVIGTPLI